MNNIPNIEKTLNSIGGAFQFSQQKFCKNGIEIEKGVVLTAERIDKNREIYEKFWSFWSVYPDLFLDFITSELSKFKLFFYQRLFLRACMRYRYINVTAPRAFSKTFISILAMILMCIFRPGIKVFICAPVKEQSAKIAKEKILEILEIYPLLEKEIFSKNFSGDYVRVTFRNGSIFDVCAAIDSTRGGRRNAGLIDEYRDHNGEDLNNIVLPLMNINRKMKNGAVNPYEPQQCQLWMSSAGDKNSYGYNKLIEHFENAIIDPTNAFVFGCDYKIPLMHGLLPKNYLNEIKTSSSFKEESFAKEYCGIWCGATSEAWFDYDKFLKHRILCNPENSEKVRENSDVFYLISVDVARLSCQTVATIFKVFPKENGYYSNLVNLFVLGKTDKAKVFNKQAIELKRLIKAYNPKEVVIDINGLGVGLGDEMIKEHYDDEKGEYYPAYGFFNDDNYKKVQPKNAINILYGIKANNELNSKMHSNCYSMVYGGYVKFLITEQEAKNKLLATRVGQKMSLEQRVKRLIPHELTSILIDEMMNLKIKQVVGTSDKIVLEQINKRMTKDKFSSFEMGLYRIKELYDKQSKKRFRHKNSNINNFVFYRKGGGR